MSAHPLLAALRSARIVPVVRTHDAALAETAVAWLKGAGFRCFEITMTVPGAPALLAKLAADKELLLGAGTVTTRADADAVLAAGARFVVAPYVAPDIVAPCKVAGAAVMLGAMTPTEIAAARAAGADVVKIFPARQAGGPAFLKAVGVLFPGVALMPTGGVDADEVDAYLGAGALCCGVGGKLVDEAALRAGDRARVEDAARRVLGGAVQRIA
ncbi:MAG: bifunctional 4-hydroxy-2-oxoglutarate aldolase/2-dehydro-3-deoxy-phosphogluconate aldolase [Alphaproteobacteria bacterium]|nr:bifunctional 4-hydroxy-2-oxoglutarate aldolase/2-dehydro-3-deoxy-phosphogluconate aldolase [Alphaproteobacteria bacterium]